MFKEVNRYTSDDALAAGKIVDFEVTNISPAGVHTVVEHFYILKTVIAQRTVIHFEGSDTNPWGDEWGYITITLPRTQCNDYGLTDEIILRTMLDDKDLHSGWKFKFLDTSMSTPAYKTVGPFAGSTVDYAYQTGIAKMMELGYFGI